jgi:hypothetical protein
VKRNKGEKNIEKMTVKEGEGQEREMVVKVKGKKKKSSTRRVFQQGNPQIS